MAVQSEGSRSSTKKKKKKRKKERTENQMKHRGLQRKMKHKEEKTDWNEHTGPRRMGAQKGGSKG